ncbi:pre-mRNA-splicing factor 38B-like isoform X1 [Dinothrombium tinctorium]|uniref:Pre-mRNA-splicing factor 38 n=1 Tax=Dinothrombium tinctorium TaxID=1965070 RepID=A0A443RBA7_9ACAR|nr:pre-mRNA-splicing factor 38B-like isoform X1 [Dinothrombium tinctorium]
MSSSFAGNDEIPLPPSESQPCVTTSPPVGVATTFTGQASITNSSVATAISAPYFDPQAAAYYHAFHSPYAAAAVGTQAFHPYFVPVVPIAPIQHNAIGKLASMPTVGQHLTAVHAAAGSGGGGESENGARNDTGSSADDDPTVEQKGKKGAKINNTLPIWGNEKTMNLNPLILTNIQNSPYFKVNLYALKTYHEVVDEIWYQVRHLEPWEKGSRRVSGQTGMCGSVRGVGAGGIVSTPFCILYKLYTLRLTRKQVIGLLKHKDSPYIRALGFMYIRYTQPPEHLWSWFEDYLEDEEELDVKAGGGQKMTIGQICKHILTKLDWFSTLFPRIPVPIQKDIEKRMNEHEREQKEKRQSLIEEGELEEESEDNHYREKNAWSSDSIKGDIIIKT